jgi:5-(carboxyamino)imidazole ribonucleotide synthase
MVGAGQLARMTQQAAIGLGVELTVLAESESDPAVLAGARCRLGSPDSLEALRGLARQCDVITFDHEGVEPGHLEALQAEGFEVGPPAAAKLLAQDKLHARRTLSELGVPVPVFAAATTIEEIEQFAAEHGWPVVAKAPRGGYDGRGVWMLQDRRQAVEVVDSAAGGSLLLEPMLDIEREIAVIVARSASGETVVYPVVETVQRDAMCREIIAPAPVGKGLADKAIQLAGRLAERIGSTGVMAVELFVTPDRLIVNELALRPHNSGHYSIEGCVTSQFEQHLRAVLGLPLGPTELTAPAVVTVNVVGTEAGEPSGRLAQALTVPGAHVHLYGKSSRPGRKLGHVTVCGTEPGPTREAARAAADALEGLTP